MNDDGSKTLTNDELIHELLKIRHGSRSVVMLTRALHLHMDAPAMPRQMTPRAFGEARERQKRGEK